MEEVRPDTQTGTPVSVYWVGVGFKDGTRSWGNILAVTELAAKNVAASHYRDREIVEMRVEHVCTIGFKDCK